MSISVPDDPMKSRRLRRKPPKVRPLLRSPTDPKVFDHLLTIKQIAAIFGVTEKTVYNWRDRREDPLPWLNMGGLKRPNVRFHRLTTLEWAKRNKMPVKNTDVLDLRKLEKLRS